jgi:hypothetical protein
MVIGQVLRIYIPLFGKEVKFNVWRLEILGSVKIPSIV